VPSSQAVDARGDIRDLSGTAGSAMASENRVGALRGAGVDANVRRVTWVVLGICFIGLASSVIVLFVAGAHRNAQIARLHQQGVPVTATVTGCIGLLGGSGSNIAGYQCRGWFELEGRHYSESIPGSTFYRPGSTLRAITVPGDPALLAKPATLASEHPSRSVFVLPTVLLGILVLSAGALFLRRRLSSTDPRKRPIVTHLAKAE
jgi:hypothetical protein